MKQSSHRRLNKGVVFIKYVIVGFTVCLLELGILYNLVHRLGLGYLLASVIAFSIGFGLSFIGRKLWAFQDFDRSSLSFQLIWYLAWYSFGVVMDMIFMVVLVKYLHTPYLLAQALANLIIGWFGFLFNRKFTFKQSRALKKYA